MMAEAFLQSEEDEVDSSSGRQALDVIREDQAAMIHKKKRMYLHKKRVSEVSALTP